MSQVQTPASSQLNDKDRLVDGSDTSSNIKGPEVIIIDSSADECSAPTVREAWCEGSLVVEILEDQPPRSKLGPTNREIVILSSSPETSSEGENTTSNMESRKRPRGLENPSNNEIGTPDKKARVGTSPKTSPTGSARASPKSVPYWRKNTSSFAGGPFGRRIRNNSPRVIPTSTELARRSLNSVCSSSSPSHSNSSENTTPPQGASRPLGSSTPPHHQIYGHAVNPERVEEWLSTNSPESLSLDMSPPRSSPRVSFPSHANREPVSKSTVKTSAGSHGQNRTQGGLIACSRDASITHVALKSPSHSLSPTTSREVATERGLQSSLKKFTGGFRQLGVEKKDSQLQTGASSSDTTPPLSPLSMLSRNSGTMACLKESGCASVSVKSSKDKGDNSQRNRKSLTVNRRRLTYGNGSDGESGLSNYTIPRLAASLPSSLLSKAPRVSQGKSPCDSRAKTHSSDLPAKTLKKKNHHRKSQLSSSPTTSSQLSQGSIIPPRLSGTLLGKGSPASHAKTLIQPLQSKARVSHSQRLSHSSESSDTGEHIPRKHSHKVSKRPYVSSDSESPHRERHKVRSISHSQPSSPFLHLAPKLSQSAKRRKIGDGTLLHSGHHRDRIRGNSCSYVTEIECDTYSKQIISSPLLSKRRHTIDSTHKTNSSSVSAKAERRPLTSPKPCEGGILRSPSIKSRERIGSLKLDGKKMSDDGKRRSSAGDVTLSRKRKRSSVSSSDGGVFSPSSFSPRHSPHSKSSDNRSPLKPTKAFSFLGSLASQDPDSPQQRLDQISPMHRKDGNFEKNKSPSTKTHHKPVKHRDEVLKKHHHHHHHSHHHSHHRKEERGNDKRTKDGAVPHGSDPTPPPHERQCEQRSSPVQRAHPANKTSPSSPDSVSGGHHCSESVSLGEPSSFERGQSSKKSEEAVLSNKSHSDYGSSSHHESTGEPSPLCEKGLQPTPPKVSSPPLSSRDNNTTNAKPPSPLKTDDTSNTALPLPHQDQQSPTPPNRSTSESEFYDCIDHHSEPVHHESSPLYEAPMCYNDDNDTSLPQEDNFYTPPREFSAAPRLRQDLSCEAGPSSVNRTPTSVPRYVSRATLSESNALSFCNTVATPSVHQPPINWRMYGAELTSDLSKSRALNKFALGNLENYSETFSNGGYSVYNYLDMLECLLAQGRFIPAEKLLQVLHIVLKNGEEHFLTKMHTLLLQDLSTRGAVSIDKRKLWEVMESCVTKLQTQPDHLASVIVLNYILNVFLKDLNSLSSASELSGSLLERVLSLQSSYSHVRKILDLVFSLPQTSNHSLHNRGVPPLLDVALCLVCLPLVTCSELDRRDVATKLARDISTRLNGLNSFDAKCQLLQRIPSNYLCEKIVDLYLDREFALPPQANPESIPSTSSALTLTKISKVHLSRTPYHHDGNPHSLNFFLRLLCILLQSHLNTLRDDPIVSISFLNFSFPSLPEVCSSSSIASCGGSSIEEIQEGLCRMNHRVAGLANRLLSDAMFCVEMTDPVNWYYFELLTSITSS